MKSVMLCRDIWSFVSRRLSGVAVDAPFDYAQGRLGHNEDPNVLRRAFLGTEHQIVLTGGSNSVERLFVAGE
jgi:hypothetical protein